MSVRHLFDNPTRSGMDILREQFEQMLDTPQDEFFEDRERCEQSLVEFCKSGWHTVEPPTNQFINGYHIGCMAEHYEAVTLGQIDKLVVNIPPRHFKSLGLVFWFCWVWTRQPQTRWIFGSYAESLSFRDSRKSLNVINSDWYQSRWGSRFTLDPQVCSPQRFENMVRGHRIATGVGTRAGGEGGEYIIADDPNKFSDVYSDLKREFVNRWWSETMATRGNDPVHTKRVIVMQRLHERDLSGHVLAADLGYQHLCLPAHGDPQRIVYFFNVQGKLEYREIEGKARTRDGIYPTKLQYERPHLRDNRKEDEPLWPEHFPKERLQDLQNEIIAAQMTGQSVGPAGQMEQRPGSMEGDLFSRKYFAYYRIEKDRMGIAYFVLLRTGQTEIRIRASGLRVFQTIDTAMTLKDSSAYTAVLTMGVLPHFENKVMKGRYLLILDAFRARIPVPQQYNFLVSMRTQFPKVLFQAIEEKSSGIGIIQQGEMDGFPFVALKAEHDKVLRAATISQLYAQGWVFHNPDMQNRIAFENELLGFPTGAFKDWVDCASYGGILYMQNKMLSLYSVDLEEIGSRDLAGDYGDVEKVDIKGYGEMVFDDDEQQQQWYNR